jgi:glycosyltransferase involved in cell wall biosynthesis
VLVLPTLTRDGWGYVVNESLAAGRPVVVSDRVGAREVIVPGRNGFVFPAGDAHALAKAIDEALALQEDAEGLGAVLRATVEGFDPRLFAQYIIGAMEAQLSHGPVPVPPWHRVVKVLGGNEEVRRWESRSWDA